MLSATATLATGQMPSRSLREGFADPPADARMKFHWFVFGPAWTTRECERQLKAMAATGAGGVLLFPAYPVAVDDESRGVHNQRYLSAEFLATLREVAEAARGLGLSFDVVGGTGWPYGGPDVSEADSSRMLRLTRVEARAALPECRGSERRVAVFALREGKYAAVSEELSQHERLVFDDVPTRMQVKRAANGADGLTVDHLNAAAVRRYLDRVAKPLVDASGPALHALFCDSLEVYRANWTAQLPAYFQKKRGYDLVPRLPALFDDGDPEAPDLRFDFWRTVADLVAQEFLATLQGWSHEHKTIAAVEAYGTPPVALAAYRHVDLPVGEHYEWKMFNTSRYASSGAHLAGRREVWAEAWTWAGIPNRFGDSLEDLKLASDMHFISGINGLIGISYSYSPESAGSPGWMPYFGPVVNHNSPFWAHMPDFVSYVSRVSFLLRQGKPVADVAIYLPAEDGLAHAPTSQVMLNWIARDRLATRGVPSEFGLRNATRFEAAVVKTIVTNGYCCDGIDWSVLASNVTVSDGRLRIGDGDYGCVVLPNLTGIAPESLEVLSRFVEQGGLLIATKRLPDRAYGLSGRDERTEKVRQLVHSLFGSVPSTQPRQVGRGTVVFCRDEEASLRAGLRLRTPAIDFSGSTDSVAFAQRQTETADIFFVANLGESAVELQARFRTSKGTTQVWDPISGMRNRARIIDRTPAGPRVGLRLEAFQSLCVVCGESEAGVSDAPLWLSDNRAGAPMLPAPLRVTGPWTLRLGDSSPVSFEQLRSWTETPSSRYFSGRGTYEASFAIPPDYLRTRHALFLDLGRVCETAEVWVNGQRAGVRWMRPYLLDITKLAQPGSNRLRVDVTNLLINQVLGAGRPDYSAVYARYGQRFPPGDEWETVREPRTSGLLGPVRIVFASGGDDRQMA